MYLHYSESMLIHSFLASKHRLMQMWIRSWLWEARPCIQSLMCVLSVGTCNYKFTGGCMPLKESDLLALWPNAAKAVGISGLKSEYINQIWICNFINVNLLFLSNKFVRIQFAQSMYSEVSITKFSLVQLASIIWL